MDCIVHGVTKSWIQLSNFHFSGGKVNLSVICNILTLLRSEIGDHMYINIHMYVYI